MRLCTLRIENGMKGKQSTKINWKWILWVATQQMAIICCQKTNFLPSWVARQKAVICGQDGLFITNWTFMYFIQMQSKISGVAPFEYKLYIFSRNIYYKCSEIERSLSKMKFTEMFSLKVHSFLQVDRFTSFNVFISNEFTWSSRADRYLLFDQTKHAKTAAS